MPAPYFWPAPRAKILAIRFIGVVNPAVAIAVAVFAAVAQFGD